MKKFLTVVAAVVVLVLIGAGVVNWLNTTKKTDIIPPLPLPPQSSQPAQPAWCPDVEVLAAPGTWESVANDDPINPKANPASFMLTVTQPLQQRYPMDKVKVWTLPYTAQFKNINAQHEMSYDQSRQEGTSKYEAELRIMHKDCPQTDFILMGFSQGAVIVGDIANQIGAGQGVVPAERIRGVAVVADGRREPGVGQAQGNPVAGVGAEVSLQLLNQLTQTIMPGATMRGPRVGGYGVLNDRVMDICAPDDHICDAPLGIGNAVQRAQALIAANAVHAQYATNPNVFPGSTTTQWLIGWATGLIDA
ncbi:cutinase family protein [Corynebacterium epidermidicanis]|uniref:Cutinase n=1 Tax=Corynebacterium epidermidicanis TaxID=1050174 RepID=A0A0G3GXB9_9CORY|nr:cutinase family protein [Corynebacterium epidermidicanis]AKK04153.1 Cutinase [Corynebacterium epidermidicanis]